jgi:branched-chain amino acid transport system permease protein
MDFLWHIIVMIGISLPSVLGYNFVFGKGKIFHFGPVGVSLITAYASVLTMAHTQSFVLSFLAGLAMALVVSMLFAWLSFRLEPDGLGVISLAVHLGLFAVVLNWNGLTRGALGMPGVRRLPFLDSVSDFALFASVIAVLVVIAAWWINRGAFGRRLSALAEHEWYAGAIGVDRTSTHFFAFAIAAVGASLSNFLFPQYLTLLHPSDYQFHTFVFFVMVIVAGGPGNVLGVTLSTAFLVVLKEAIRFVALPASMIGPVRLILFGIILFIAVWLRRDTLFPTKREI